MTMQAQLIDGRFFWNELTQAWPLAISASEVRYAVLEFDGQGLMIVVSKIDLNAYDGFKVCVLNNLEIELTVMLFNDFTFLNAEASSGLAFDEELAVDQLRLLMPRHGGLWHYSQQEEM